MADDQSEPRKIVVDYGGNSQKARGAAKPKDEPEKEKVVEQVTSGKVVERKRPLGRKIIETFTGDDMHSVRNYIVFDVAVPAIKSLISDMVAQGIERTLFGDSRPRAGRSTSSGSYTPYNRVYAGSSSGTSSTIQPRTLSREARANHDFREVVLESRADAELALDSLIGLVDQYRQASVADMLDLVGISGNFTDNKWGWDDLREARVRPVRGGYLLDLPPTKPID